MSCWFGWSGWSSLLLWTVGANCPLSSVLFPLIQQRPGENVHLTMRKNLAGTVSEGRETDEEWRKPA